jgi:hypothetical protein
MSAGRLVREGAVGELLALAGARRYRIVALAPGRAGAAWSIEEMEVPEEELADALGRQRDRGARVLQILAQRGSLEEVLLDCVRQAEAGSDG